MLITAVRPVALTAPYGMPGAQASRRSAVFVEVETADGLVGGEGITTATTFNQWLAAGAFDISQPDPTIVGGIAEARRVCDAADLYDVRVAMHVWGSGPTLMANYHLGFTVPNCFILEMPVMKNPLDAETLVEPIVLVDGHVEPPTAPGVVLSDEVKAKYPFEAGSASLFG